MKSKELNELFEEIKHELGDPPIKLLRRVDWDRTHHAKLNSFLGKSNYLTNEIVVMKSLGQDKLTVTLYHEILHILFPTRPHWWIEKASHLLSKNSLPNLGRYTARYNKQNTKIESREEIIRLAKLSARRISAGEN